MFHREIVFHQVMATENHHVQEMNNLCLLADTILYHCTLIFL